MRNKRRNRETFAEPSFWQSYSDMMAALLLVFVLMIAITLAIYKQKTTDLDQTRLELSAAEEDLEASRLEIEKSQAELTKSNKELAASLAELQEAYKEAALTQEELNNAYLEIESAQKELATTKSELQDIVGIRTNIITALQDTIKDSGMTVDPQTGSITFSSDVLFQYNSSKLTAKSKESLKEVIPKYLGVLLQEQYRGYIAEIIIEGHTDTDGTYQSNQTLSYDRAYAVSAFCQDTKNGLNENQIKQLQQLLTVNGRSYSNPVYGTNGRVDMEASRRVEIKFRLKEDEMIERITEVLNREQGQN